MICVFFYLLVALTGALDVHHLTKKVGEDVTFDLEAQELKYDDMVVWSHGPNNDVIYNVHIGKDKEINSVKRFSLNLITGSLTIHNLSSGEADVYLGQIINGQGTQKRFNLTVVGEWFDLKYVVDASVSELKRLSKAERVSTPSWCLTLITSRHEDLMAAFAAAGVKQTGGMMHVLEFLLSYRNL